MKAKILSNAVPGWDEASLAELRRKMSELTHQRVDRVLIAPAGHFILEAGTPEARVAAFFTIPIGVQSGIGQENIVVVSHAPFTAPMVDSLIWGVHTKEELERFWDGFPMVRSTQHLILFMRHPTLGTAVSHSAYGHAHILKAFQYVQETLLQEAHRHPIDYSNLPRGRVHVHVTSAPTVTFSTIWNTSESYQIYKDRIILAVNDLYLLGFPLNTVVVFQGKEGGQTATTLGELLRLPS